MIGAVALFGVGFRNDWTVNGWQYGPEMRMSSHRIMRLNRVAGLVVGER